MPLFVVIVKLNDNIFLKVVWRYYNFRIKTTIDSSLPPAVCRGLVSYIRYLCLFACGDGQHILCCGFVLFFCVLWTLYCKFIWIVHFWLFIRYSLTFIEIQSENSRNRRKSPNTHINDRLFSWLVTGTTCHIYGYKPF